jgi:ABC-type dipeptide/oligopeptide/nickel transport system permease component
MINFILKKFWAFGLFIAFWLALILAIVFSVWSWIENPGGIFRDSVGTNWRFVYDTAESWFNPTFLYTFVIASSLHLAANKLRSIFNSKTKSRGNDVDDG